MQKKYNLSIVAMSKLFLKFMIGESISGILLIAAASAAIIWANSPSAPLYHKIIHLEFFLGLGKVSVSTSLLHLINDAFMAVFFLLVGLEIKREVFEGELSSFKKAFLPAAGALGGMIVPVVIYFIINMGSSSLSGWGIPMATDIAFSLGILYLLGDRVPLSLKVFLSALAIVDDLGAVVVIALFYSSGIAWYYIGASVLIIALLFFINKCGVRSISLYVAGGILLWTCMLFSGIHSSIAGVVLALVIPSSFEKDIYGGVWSPSQRIENALHPVVLYMIMPLFAFANAGVEIQWNMNALFNPATMGVAFGLLVGKPAGIYSFSMIAIKTGLCEKPRGVSNIQFLGVAVLGGIGFTMSLFIAGLSFADDHLLTSAKTGIILGSILSAVVGVVFLAFSSPSHCDKKRR